VRHSSTRLSCVVIAAADIFLVRLCLDASNLSTVLAGVIPTTRLGTYRLSFSPDIRQ